MTKLNIINMDEVQSKEVDWLWYPYIPYGKITIIQGDPGEGKTTLVLRLAAMLSRGEKLPCDDNERMPINIIYQTAEDGLEDTIKPRLEQGNADCTHIKVIDESMESLTLIDERVEQAIQEVNAKLIIFDPIQAYVGGDKNMNAANDVRGVLKRLSTVAEKYRCAVVLIGHMNKCSNNKSSYRGLGSIDFQAAARSVLIVARDKDNQEIRIMAQDKSSLAPEGKSIAFELNKDNGFTWQGQCEITVSELLGGSGAATKLEIAKRVILEKLENGECLYSEIMRKCELMEISKRVAEMAKSELNVKSKKKGKDWYWLLES